MKARVCQIIIFLAGIISAGYAQNIIVGAEKDNFYIDLLLNKNARQEFEKGVDGWGVWGELDNTVKTEDGKQAVQSQLQQASSS